MNNIEIETLKKNLQKLKANEENMTAEQKERYAPALKKLKAEINNASGKLLKWYIFSDLIIDKSDNTTVLQSHFKNICDKAIEAGEIKAASKTLYSKYSCNEFLKSAEPLKKRIEEAYCREYWARHCQKDAFGVWHNDLIDMDWDSEKEIWISTKNNDFSFSTAFPPCTFNEGGTI